MKTNKQTKKLTPYYYTSLKQVATYHVQLMMNKNSLTNKTT